MAYRLIFLFFWWSASLHGAPVSLSDALAKGMVTIQASGLGGHAGQTILLKIQNQKGKLDLQIPAGWLFTAEDTTNQDLIVTQSQLLALEKGQTKNVRLEAYCARASRLSPSLGTAFSIGLAVSGPLAQLARFIDERGYRGGAVQSAVWAVTDDHPVNSIDNPELARFTAELLGKPLPAYTIQHAYASAPGRPAFRPAPAIAKGIFAYSTDRQRKVSFGLYDDSGKLLKSFFDNQDQRPGHHRFEFFFQINGLPPGKYYARLTSEGESLGSLELQW